VLKVLLLVAVVTMTLEYLLNLVKRNNAENCAKALRAAEESLQTQKAVITSTASSNSISSPIKRGRINGQLILIKNALENARKEGGGCNKLHLIPAYETIVACGTIEANKDVANQAALIVQCINAAKEALKTAARQKDKEVEALKNADPISALLGTMRELFDDGLPKFLKYAAYTALGLGVIWGGGKVYKSLRK
jgi:hypothetical protein